MASASRTFTLNLPYQGGAFACSSTITADEEADFQFSVGANATNEVHIFTVTAAKLQLVYLKSDQGMTLKTNSSGSPQDTITLVAGVPLLWVVGCGLTIPFAGNVTTGYWSNGSASVAANIQLSIMQNT